MALDYRKLQIYDLSYQLVLDIYKATDKFPESEHNNLSSQLRRAAVSMPLNIAEGSSRRSKKEFLNFLNYSFGSGKEIEVILQLSRDLGFLTSYEFEDLSQHLNLVMSKLFLFIRSVEERIPGTKHHFELKVRRNSNHF
ncbi:four helix bundle protein [Candidatus Woesearchaeota archaeon]|nr:four helix bundle protein [Candidatus Woesearchaeota archaeon]